MQRRIPKKVVQRRFVSEEEALAAKLARKSAVGRPATGTATGRIVPLTLARIRKVQAALTQALNANLPDSTEALVRSELAYLATRVGEHDGSPSKAQGRQSRTYSVRIGAEPETHGHSLASAAEALAVSPLTLRQYLSAGDGTYTRKHPSATVSVESRQSPEES